MATFEIELPVIGVYDVRAVGAVSESSMQYPYTPTPLSLMLETETFGLLDTVVL